MKRPELVELAAELVVMKHRELAAVNKLGLPTVCSGLPCRGLQFHRVGLTFDYTVDLQCIGLHWLALAGTDLH